MNDESTVVGVVGTGESVDELTDRLVDRGVDVLVDDQPALQKRDVDLVVAVGETAISEVVSARPSVPIVPVDAGAGIRGVPLDAADALPESITAGAWETEPHRPLSVEVGDEPVGTAVFDVTLVTTEAARISEYAVDVDGDRLDRSRADGVVVATPAGSTDYARRVESPVLAPETGLAVAWIAPFRSDPDRWVVEPSSLSVTVQRDGSAVDLVVDDAVVRTVGPEHVVSLEPTAPFEVAVVAASQRRYE